MIKPFPWDTKLDSRACKLEYKVIYQGVETAMGCIPWRPTMERQVIGKQRF